MSENYQIDTQICSICHTEETPATSPAVCTWRKEFRWVRCYPFQTYMCKACRVKNAIPERGFLVPLKEGQDVIVAVEDWLVKAKEAERNSSNEEKREAGPDLTPKVHISRREWDRYIESIKETCIVYEDQYPDHYPVLSIPSVAFTFSKMYLKMTHIYKNHLVELLRN